jgi:nucleolar protein 12
VKHEDAKEKIRDEEKEGRTVFVGNVPGSTSEKSIRNLFKTFGDIEAIRFRGAARPGSNPELQ